MSVDIVIVAHNSRDRLRNAAAPFLAVGGVDVFIVDNASTDGTLAAVAGLPMHALPQHENRGFAAGSNIGWRAGRAPYVLFLNPDAELSQDALRRLVDVLEERPSAGAVAPRIVDPAGQLDFSLRRFPRLRSTFAQALFLHRLFPTSTWSGEVVMDPRAYEHASSPEWVPATCLLVRRSVLEQLGGFDEGFFLYCEDIDLCLRLQRAGYEVRYEPSAVALHTGGASAPRAGLLPVLAASHIRYARKHHGHVHALLERLGIALGAITHSAAGRAPTRGGHVRALATALGLRRS